MVESSPTSLSGLSYDDDDYCSPSPSSCDEGADVKAAAMDDEKKAPLVTAGPSRAATAAAISSAKKRKRPHSFVINRSIRKRHQNRLLRKLQQTIDEFAARVGQQAILLVVSLGEPNTSYKVYGAQPLEDVIKNLRSIIMEELESVLAHQAPLPLITDPTLFELPPLIINEIPTPVEKMTQAQLRAFIPLMLKYSTGRGKPGWGRESHMPPWWPKELPWANIRIDARSKDEKQKTIPTSPITTQLPSVGSVSIIQADLNNPIIALPDGTMAHVQYAPILQLSQGDDTEVHTIQTLGKSSAQGEVVDLNSVVKVLNTEGQIIFSDKGDQVSGEVTMPVLVPMYPMMFANIQHLHTFGDGTVCMIPIVQVPKVEPNSDDNMESLTMPSTSLTTDSVIIQELDNDPSTGPASIVPKECSSVDPSHDEYSRC